MLRIRDEWVALDLDRTAAFLLKEREPDLQELLAGLVEAPVEGPPSVTTNYLPPFERN